MPRLQWNGTGNRHIDVPGVGPRGLVVLVPGVNEVTDAELAAMGPSIKLELDNGVIVVLPEGADAIVPMPGMVEPLTPEEEAATAKPASTTELPPAADPEPSAASTGPQPEGSDPVVQPASEPSPETAPAAAPEEPPAEGPSGA